MPDDKYTWAEINRITKEELTKTNSQLTHFKQEVESLKRHSARLQEIYNSTSTLSVSEDPSATGPELVSYNIQQRILQVLTWEPCSVDTIISRLLRAGYKFNEYSNYEFNLRAVRDWLRILYLKNKVTIYQDKFCLPRATIPPVLLCTNSISINASKLTREIHKKIYECVEKSGYQLLIETVPRDEGADDVPVMPWDADFDIEEIRGIDHLALNGGLGPCGFGSVVVRVPLAQSSMYEVILDAPIGEHIPSDLVELVKSVQK